MPPNSSATISTTVAAEKKTSHENFGATYLGIPFRTKIVWPNVSIFVVLHSFALYGIYLIATGQYNKSQTVWFTLLLHSFSGIIGVTAGAHRLWTHRSYKAKWPLRLVMMLFNTVTGQNSIHEWTRDHRVHHKFSDTDADPHNTGRGFFFAHIGWLLMKKHPDVITKGKKIDLSDIEADPIIMFQKNNYKWMTILLCYVVPTLIPCLMWNEEFIASYMIAGVLRHLITLHSTWSVNSAAHFWGNKPYDEQLKPSENLLVCWLAQGEGYHNYHHTFPHDYSTSEYRLGVNLTTAFIDLMAYFGQASDRRKVSKETIHNRRKRTGNLQHNPST